ncbi:MAG TPA: N-acetylmuramoyl-L-alanine amidase-like domain-containing protein [Gemmatimonadales bacterium]
MLPVRGSAELLLPAPGGMMFDGVSRRRFLAAVPPALLPLLLPRHLIAAAGRDRPSDPDLERLRAWSARLRDEGLDRADRPFGWGVTRAGELAAGSPYVAFTLEEYLAAGGAPAEEPLALSLTRFDCVTLVESAIAVARAALASEQPSWEGFGREVERMRYRDGRRDGYASRLHYFSEWIADGARRGLLTDLGPSLGAMADARPLRFMTEHRASYAALADDATFARIAEVERGLDGAPRQVVPRDRIADVADRIESGDVLAFATSIPGLDVTHAALAWKREGELRVLHAPLSGGVVEVTRSTLPEYVAALRGCTGILVARPLRGP